MSDPRWVLYGKLPWNREFLRVGVVSGPGAKLREWIDTGFDPSLFEGATKPSATLGRFSFAADPKTELRGVIRMSEDARGRKFPCAVARVAPLTERVSEWAGAEELYEKARGETDLAALEELCATFEEPKQSGAGPRIEDWRKFASQVFEEDGEYLFTKALWRLRHWKLAGEPEMAFHCPIGGLGREGVAAWLSVFESLGGGPEAWRVAQASARAVRIARGGAEDELRTLLGGKSLRSRVANLEDFEAKVPTEGFREFCRAVSDDGGASLEGLVSLLG